MTGPSSNPTQFISLNAQPMLRTITNTSFISLLAAQSIADIGYASGDISYSAANAFWVVLRRMTSALSQAVPQNWQVPVNE